ncbi:hypothetical protein LINPERHAP2_LOCUS11795, partial [Linum perenne]
PLFSLSSISADLSLPLSLIFSSQPFSHLLHPLFLSSSSLLISHPNEHTQQRRNQTSSSPEDTVAATPPAPSPSSGSERRHRLVDAAGARGHRQLLVAELPPPCSFHGVAPLPLRLAAAVAAISVDPLSRPLPSGRPAVVKPATSSVEQKGAIVVPSPPRGSARGVRMR